MEFPLYCDISPFVRNVKIEKWLNIMEEFILKDSCCVYVKSGSADFIINGITYNLCKGYVIIIPPFYPYLVIKKSEDPYIECVFSFDLFTASDTPLTMSKLKENGVRQWSKDQEVLHEIIYKNLNYTEQIYFEKSFSVMLKEFINKDSGHYLVEKAIAIDLFTQILRSKENINRVKKIGAFSWSNIDKAMKYINEHFNSYELNNKCIAESIGLTPNYLTSIFKLHIGLSVHKYLNNVRINNAKRMIEEGDKNLTEIAFDSGFKSIHSFSKIFKREVGLSPSFYCNYDMKNPRLIN